MKDLDSEALILVWCFCRLRDWREKGIWKHQEIKKEGKLWRLKKLLYGPSDV